MEVDMLYNDGWLIWWHEENQSKGWSCVKGRFSFSSAQLEEINWCCHWRRCCMANPWSKGGPGWWGQEQCLPFLCQPISRGWARLGLQGRGCAQWLLCAEELHVSEAPLMHNQLENMPEVPEGKQPTHEQVWMSRPLFQHRNEGRTCSGWGPPP